MAKVGMAAPALLLLLVALVSEGEMGPVRCCLSYSEKPFPVALLHHYHIQDIRGSCNIDAVVFTTVRGRKICANPNDQWVQEAMEHIQDKKGA
ncbi:C-C motif chemokine 19-like [Megalops cyprinoides]|uniref:C-C motif chemokine 19-like n=1 Tax=Megalops cyprinoides TaxID=118141 RepID=UPI0018650486|nr:C-C motif chemokine 19-like [Megalops cyprinoides]